MQYRIAMLNNKKFVIQYFMCEKWNIFYLLGEFNSFPEAKNELDVHLQKLEEQKANEQIVETFDL